MYKNQEIITSWFLFCEIIYGSNYRYLHNCDSIFIVNGSEVRSMKDLKCNSCGSQLHKIENEENTYVCLHCGNKQVLEDNVTNNSYTVTNHVVNNIYGNVTVDDQNEGAVTIQKVKTYIKLKEYKKAYEFLIELVAESPELSELWWLLSKVSLMAYIEYLSKGMHAGFDTSKYEDYYNKAKTVGGSEEIKAIELEYSELKSKLDELIEKRKKVYTLKPLYTALIVTAIIVTLMILFALLMQ